MRFDDTLNTVLAGDVSTAFGKASTWRQLVDLIGRRRVTAHEQALALLDSIRAEVPLSVRAGSARALENTDPPYCLVRLCAVDDISVAAPVLRRANLNTGDWIDLLPNLSAVGRAVVRERRDLPTGVEAALAMFTADFAIEDAAAPVATPSETNAIELEAVEAPDALAGARNVPQGSIEADDPSPSTFVTIGAAALSIPVVAAAIRHVSEEGSGEAGQREISVEPLAAGAIAHESALTIDSSTLSEPVSTEREGPFEIAEVVARIDAFYNLQQDRSATLPVMSHGDRFRFETDEQGVIRWVDGVSRAPLIGMSLDMTAQPGACGVDGVAAGAFRKRSAFSGARLNVAGDSDASGDWRISASAAFDPATGRFLGYRGTARRPRADESPVTAITPDSSGADSLRQLMHELRTPTNAIAGFAEMIEREILGDVPDVYRRRAATVREHSRALLAAIDDLDIAARIEGAALRLQPAEVAMGPLLVRTVDDLSALAALRGAQITLPSDTLSVRGDPRAIERLVARLLATVVSAAGEGEQIELRLAAGNDERVALSLTRPHALAAYTGEEIFGIDDEAEDMALLGTGFALRLIRNLSHELSGSFVIQPDSMTIWLPAVVTKSLEVVR